MWEYDDLINIISFILTSDNTKVVKKTKIDKNSLGAFSEDTEVSENFNIVWDINAIVSSFRKVFNITRTELFNLNLIEYYTLLNEIWFADCSINKIVEYRQYKPSKDDDKDYKFSMQTIKESYKIDMTNKTFDRLMEEKQKQQQIVNKMYERIGVGGRFKNTN